MMQFILLAPWVPLLAAVILLLGSLFGLRGNGRSLAILAAGTGLGCGLAGTVLSGSAPGHVDGLPGLLSALFGGGRLAHAWLLATGWTALLLFLWPVSPNEDTRLLRQESIAGLVLLSLTQLVVLSANAYVQWTLMVLSAWAVAGIVGGAALSGGRPASPQAPDSPGVERLRHLRGTWRGLMTLTVADLMWLLGLLSAERAFGTLEISRITETIGAADLERHTFQFGLLVTSGFWLLCSLMIRCGLFPVMGWLSEMAVGVPTRGGSDESDADAMQKGVSCPASAAVPARNVGWLVGFTLAQGVFLLLQWQPVVAVSGEQQALIVGLSGLSALLLGVMAMGRPTGPVRSAPAPNRERIQPAVSLMTHSTLCRAEEAHKLIRVTGVMVALVWLGGVAFPPGVAGIAAFALAVVLLAPLTALLLPTLAGSVLNQDSDSSDPAPSDRSGLAPAFWMTVVVLLFGSGVLGQERVFEAVWSGVRTTEGRLPAAMLGVVLLAHGLGSFVLFRIRFRARAPFATTEPETSGPRRREQSEVGPGSWCVGLLSALTMAMAGLTLFSPGWLVPGSGLSVPAIGGTAIVGAIALVAAWTWPSSARPLSGLDSVQRLADREFYSQTIIQAIVVVPIRGVTQVVRLTEWLVIEPVVMRVSRSLFQQLYEVATVMDEETRPSPAAVTLGLATGVMLLGLLLSRWM